MHYFPTMSSFLVLGVTQRAANQMTKPQLRIHRRPFRHNFLHRPAEVIFFLVAQIHRGNSTQLNFSWRSDRGFLYKYCYLGHHWWREWRARTLSSAPSQSCFSPQTREILRHERNVKPVNRLDTDLTTTLARCLRRRDDNWPTLSMTETHAIANRRQNSLREAILPVFAACVPSWGTRYKWRISASVCCSALR